MANPSTSIYGGIRVVRCIIRVGLLGMLAVALLAPSAHAAFPGHNGKIAFHLNIGNGIFTINPDGTERTRLTEVGSYPAWSPDGRKIAFEAFYHVFVMRADGQGQIDLGSGFTPAWSVDGTKILFVSDDVDRRVWVMNSDGTGRRPVTSGINEASPAWSPDGSRIAFRRVTYAPNSEQHIDIWTVAPDGSDARNLTEGRMGNTDSPQLVAGRGAHHPRRVRLRDVDDRRYGRLQDAAGLRRRRSMVARRAQDRVWGREQPHEILGVV